MLPFGDLVGCFLASSGLQAPLGLPFLIFGRSFEHFCLCYAYICSRQSDVMHIYTHIFQHFSEDKLKYKIKANSDDYTQASTTVSKMLHKMEDSPNCKMPERKSARNAITADHNARIMMCRCLRLACSINLRAPNRHRAWGLPGISAKLFPFWNESRL